MSTINQLKTYFDSFNAAQCAELFLSPHIEKELLHEISKEPGPTMWIINRSDVFDETLELLKDHPIPGMALRASEKLRKRRSPDANKIPPAMEQQIAEIPENSVEDILGHPLVPWESIHFFATAPNPDHRASAALSICRKVLEHPPEWKLELGWFEKLYICFKDRLENDTSSYVRSYCARIPFLRADTLEEAFQKEKDPMTMGKILQHINSTPQMIEEALTNVDRKVFNNGHVQTIAALDKRANTDTRKSIVKSISDPLNFVSLIHRYYTETI